MLKYWDIGTEHEYLPIAMAAGAGFLPFIRQREHAVTFALLVLLDNVDRGRFE